MIPGLELAACANLAVPAQVMRHVVQVESRANPFAIGVVGGQLVRQPKTLDEAVATAQMLESRGYNYSLGAAQVNRSNFQRYGLDTHEKAFDLCTNLSAGARILAACYNSAHGDWGKAFSCYYSGNFVTGFRSGYVQKIYDSINREAPAAPGRAIASAPIALRVASGGSASTSGLPSTSGLVAEKPPEVKRPSPEAARISMRVTAPAPAPSGAALANPLPASALPMQSSAPSSVAAAPSDVFVPQVRRILPGGLGNPAGTGNAPATALAPNAPATPVQGAAADKPSDGAFVF